VQGPPIANGKQKYPLHTYSVFDRHGDPSQELHPVQTVRSVHPSRSCESSHSCHDCKSVLAVQKAASGEFAQSVPEEPPNFAPTPQNSRLPGIICSCGCFPSCRKSLSVVPTGHVRGSVLAGLRSTNHRNFVSFNSSSIHVFWVSVSGMWGHLLFSGHLLPPELPDIWRQISRDGAGICRTVQNKKTQRFHWVRVTSSAPFGTSVGGGVEPCAKPM